MHATMGFSRRVGRARAYGLLAFGLPLLLAVACGDDGGGSGSPEMQAGQAGEGGASGSDAGAANEGGAPPIGEAGRGEQPGGGAPDAGGAGGAGGEQPLEFLDRLDHLGADTTLSEDPSDGNDALPAGYHPLKTTYATFDGRDEIYFAGPLWANTGQREGILDDGFSGSFAPLLTAQFTPWLTSNYRTAVAADVDGDGHKEFVGVFYDAQAKKLMAKITHGPHGKVAAYDEAPFILADAQTVPDQPIDAFQHCVAAANVDDDPAEEIVVVFRDLFFFDDLNHQMKEITAAHEALNSGWHSVARGDFDAVPADPHDELIVMYQAAGAVQRFQIYDGLTKKLETGGRQIRPILNDSAHSELNLHWGWAITGEFDGDDPQQEIAMISGDDYAWRFMIMDDASANYRTFDSYEWDVSDHDRTLVAADIDGDGVDEVWATDYIFDGLETLPTSADRTQVPDIHAAQGVNKIDPLIDPYQVRAGRVSPDLATPQQPRVEQFVAIMGNQLMYSARNPTQNNAFAWVKLGDSSQWSDHDALAVGNVDDDSPIVKYTGDHELLYAEPELLVAMAAPPFYADTNQEANSSTSFGKGSGTSIERESSIGFSIGFSFGYESKDPFGIASSSLTFSVNQEFDSVAKRTSTQSQLVTYTSGPEDSVVFTVVPFDVYYYEVVSAANSAEVGNTLSLNMPRKPQTLLASAEYFDRYVDASRQSAPLFATHVVGDPLSYATETERDVLCGGHCFKSSEALPIGQGTGYTTIEISEADSQGSGVSYKLSTEVRSEASLGGVKVGSSVGFNYGFSIEASTETTTIFTGKLGSLKGLTPDNSYSAGIFAHQQAHPASIKPVLVVDYWVE